MEEALFIALSYVALIRPQNNSQEMAQPQRESRAGGSSPDRTKSMKLGQPAE